MKKKRILVVSIVTFIILLLGFIVLPVVQKVRIEQAISWQSDNKVMGCTMALTPAIDILTGARHTFNNGCLPPGWIANR